jgi:uncharacterized caspase-like protein
MRLAERSASFCAQRGIQAPLTWLAGLIHTTGLAINLAARLDMSELKKVTRHVALAVVALTATLILAPATHAERWALIVAVSQYPSLAKHRQLSGPKNDARAMMAFLQANKAISRQHITVLADQVADADASPTRGRILEALMTLASRSAPGDEVWLYFAGHGSQQPQSARSAYVEPDGLDEIFLPLDIGHWDGTIGRVSNAIVDDEIGVAIDAIRVRGANVVAIFDTCHSADSVRAVGTVRTERPRAVPATELGIPHLLSTGLTSAIRRASALKAAVTRDERAVSSVEVLSAQNGTLTAIYASMSHETTPELLVATSKLGRRTHGLFTHSLIELWSRYPSASAAEIVEQLKARYRSLGRTAPTPSLFSQSQKSGLSR